MNAYATVDSLKDSLNIAGAGEDNRLLRLIEAASRAVDGYCNRHFYTLRATRRFDGNGGNTLLIPDLVSIDKDGLRTDRDLDGVFETTWSETGYLLLPANADPASASNPASRPYTRIEAAAAGAGLQRFPTGRGTVRIAGLWGWWLHLRRASETLAATVTDAATVLTVTARADVEAGHTLQVGSEQIYVRSYEGSRLNVARGANGTTAAAHDRGAPIDIFEYPPGITEATIIQAARLLRLSDGTVDSPTGPRGASRRYGAALMDADAAFLLAGYRKAALGVGVA